MRVNPFFFEWMHFFYFFIVHPLTIQEIIIIGLWWRSSSKVLEPLSNESLRFKSRDGTT